MSEKESIKIYVCGNCGYRWFICKSPEKGCLTCPSCGVEGKVGSKGVMKTV